MVMLPEAGAGESVELTLIKVDMDKFNFGRAWATLILDFDFRTNLKFKI